MFRQMPFTTACAVAVAFWVAALAWGQASFQGVGDLPGGETESFAYGISGDGSTVVGMSLSASGQEAFRWKNGVITGLGDLLGGAFESSASGASLDGTVVVGSGRDANGLWAVAWANDLPAVLNGLPEATSSGAQDVSADGLVIVGWSDSSRGEQAVLWQNNTVLPLDDLSSTIHTSRALAVSPNGQLIVGWRAVSFGFEAFQWTMGSMTGLGFLPDGFDSQAFGVSSDGRAVGYSMNNGIEAVVWHDGTVAALGFLPGGLSASALDVSADGRVIVGSGNTASSPAEAFIWDARRGIRPLKHLLVQQYGLNLDGWSLEEAHAISDDGRTIVGAGRNPAGQNEGWVARLPVIVPADFDEDGDVDGEDLDTLHLCGTGPGVPYRPDLLPPACLLLTFDPDGFLAADFDKDKDIDQADFAVFQRCLSGQGVEPNPGCEQ